MRLWWWLGAVAAGCWRGAGHRRRLRAQPGSFAAGVACSSISRKLLHEQPAAAGTARGSGYGGNLSTGQGLREQREMRAVRAGQGRSPIADGGTAAQGEGWHCWMLLTLAAGGA